MVQLGESQPRCLDLDTDVNIPLKTIKYFNTLPLAKIWQTDSASHY